MIESKTQKIVVGIVLTLTNDEATHLGYALSRAKEGYISDGRKWPWLDKFCEELEKKRGVGCSMGPRVRE